MAGRVSSPRRFDENPLARGFPLAPGGVPPGADPSCATFLYGGDLMKKRIFSLFLALTLCLTLLPAPAWAAEPDVSETPDAAVAAVQARIDALPDAETLPNMDGDAAMAAYDAVQAAYDAYEALTEAQQAKIAGADRFEALFGWFDDQVAPLADGTEENIYYTYDSVDENGNITQGTASLTGPLLTENDKTLSGQYYIVQGNMIIDGNLTVDGSQMGGLVLCAGATLTVNGALIHNGGSSFGIYGTSNNGADAGELVINNSLDNGAAIRTGSTSTPQLNIYSGEVTINAGNSGKLVEGVELYSTSKIHAATLAAKKVLPAEWRGVSSIKGTSLVLEYCGHAEDDPEYVDYVEVGETQHRWQCKACGFEGGVEACFTNTTISGITPNDNGTHTWKCICGREKNGNCSYESLSTPEATPDGKGHTARMCSVCGSPEGKAEAHTYDADGKCTACTFEPLAKDEAGDLYGRTQDHSDVSLDVNDALAEGHTITLWRPDTIASKTIQGIYIDFDAAGKSATLDMNGYSLETSKSAPITVENGTLTVTGDATLVQNGTQELASSAVRVTGGTLIFDGKLTATGASGKPAVEVTNGTLRLKEGDVLNGGVSVEGSTTYANVNALLGENLAFAKVGATSAIVKGDVTSISGDVTVVAHTHGFTRGSDGKYTCACGYTCPHNDFKDGKCTICGNGCAHTDVGDDGVCRNCQTQMVAKIEVDGKTTYSTDFQAAMKAATNGTKITLLADVSIPGRTGISGDNTTVTLDLNEHKITSGWLDVGDRNATYTTRTLKIIGKGSYEPPQYGGIITVYVKATLDLSEWEGGTISEINISDNSNHDAATREPAVIVGSTEGTIGKLSFGNNQLDELKKTKLSGGSFNEIWAAAHQPVKLGELLADGYAFQNGDGSYVEYETTLKDASIYNVKVVKCPHAKINEDGHCAYCNATGFVAQVTAADGSSSAYTDIAAAIAAADGGTVKLLANAGEITIGSPLKLDLNGKTAAKLTVTGDVTLASLLPEGCAFKSGSTWITDLTGTELTNVSMAKLPIKSMDYETKMSMTYGGMGTLLVKVTKEPGTGAVTFQWYKVEGGKETAVGSATTKNQFDLSALKLPAGQHTFRFSATCDGYEKMSQDIAVTVQKANISASLITPPTAQENLTYTGREQALITAGSVTDYGTMQYSLTENGTYSQDIPTGTDAGTYTVWYRVIGDANHNDTAPASVAVSIGKKPLTITGVTAASKPYDGTTNADITSVTFDNVTLNRGTDYTVTASFDDASVGNGKNIIATVTLMEQTAKNYALEQSSFTTTGSITKAAAPDFIRETALVIINGYEKTYTVTLPALPTLETPKEYGAPTYELGEIKLNDGYYTSGAKVENGELTLPIQKNDVETTGSVGTVTVVIKSANYEDITLTVNVNATNKLVPTVTAPTANALTYNGAEQALVTAGKTTGGTMLYRLDDSEWSEQIPTAKNAGEYTVWYKVQGNAEYADVAEQSLTVTVAKKAVTVTVLDKSAYTGSTAPDLSSPEADKDYKVEGLVGADTLSGTVTLDYAQTPDMSKAGEIAINITGTLSNDNYEITYVPGTLTVSDRPSSGGGGGSSTPSVSVPVSSDYGGTKLSATISGSTATVSVSGKEIDKVIADGAKSVTVDLSGLSKVDSVKLPASVIAKTEEAEDTGLTIRLPDCAVELDEAALESIASGKTVTVSVQQAKLTDAQQEAVSALAQVAVVVDVDIVVGTVKQSAFDGGRLTISIPYTPEKGEDTSTLAVWYIRDDGSIENKGGSYDAKSGCFVFETDHLSRYLLVHTEQAIGFTDVPADAWYAGAVAWAVEQGITSGTGNGKFSPDGSCTRAQMVTFLWRVNGSPGIGTANPFSDVSSDAYYYDAVLWAVEQGITGGTGDGKFSPDAPCTRAQMATFLWRANGSPEVTGTTPFSDVSAGTYYYNAVLWAYERKITNGTGGRKFSPDATCTRAQMVQMLKNASDAA
ncbi:S-layer homology domain-containing protein [Flavonifractor plautii]|uniref:S-layer homology domain-containing protein n=2 Tax=Flavonifractor plautii TaxID=292800 RepID=UPI00319E235F